MDTTIVNLSNLETTILFVLGVLAALVAVDKGVEAFRHLFLRCRSMQEAGQNDRLNRVERVEAAHQTRLDAGDKKAAEPSFCRCFVCQHKYVAENQHFGFVPVRYGGA